MIGIDLTNPASARSAQDGHVELCLRVWHPDADPEQISQALQLQPTLAYRAGEPRVTPKGRQLSSVHRETLWSFDVDVPPGASLADAISAADSLVAPHREEMLTLKSVGARVEYFVGLFLEGDQTEVLDSKLMSRCAERGVDLVLSVYVPRKDPERDQP